MVLRATRFAVFGQELYFEESIRAIGSFHDVPEHDRLSARIAEQLPYSSPATRLRVATKIVQRFFKSPDGKSHAAPFLRLVNGLKSESARRDLLYWRTARTDSLIAAIAGEIFYPYFVLNELPQGYDEASFRMANTAALFSVDRVISLDFAVEYARRMWNFDSARTVTLALRIMRQAGMIDAVNVEIGDHHVLSYYPLPHSMSPEVFAYCMGEEFLDAESLPAIPLDRLYNGDCVRLFFLGRLQANSILKSLEQRCLIERTTLRGARHARFTVQDLDALAGSLIPST